MHVAVLNGSPKGNLSVTLQYVLFLQQHFPDHTFSIHHIGERIRAIEKKEAIFDDIIEDCARADGILWSFPIYYMLVPAQMKRFIELIAERNAEASFAGKRAVILSTSIHFFDHTAHHYMSDVCTDLGMHDVLSFSADMQDLFRPHRRRNLLLFAERFFSSMEEHIPSPPDTPRRSFSPRTYRPVLPPARVDGENMTITLVTDHHDTESNLARMVERFQGAFENHVDIINLNDMSIAGACLGCLQCGYDNTCCYEGKDEFVATYRRFIAPADILVYAGAIEDHFLSSRWKTFFDRSFFNNHIPHLAGKQIGFLISGDYSRRRALREFCEAYPEMQRMHLAGIATDESGDAPHIDATLDRLAAACVLSAKQHYETPQTFLGVGGSKLFRDAVWGRLRFVFQADHRYYRRHGLYDFPYKKIKQRLFTTVMMTLTRIPAIRRDIYTRRMNEEMVKPYRKLLSGKRR